MTQNYSTGGLMKNFNHSLLGELTKCGSYIPEEDADFLIELFYGLPKKENRFFLKELREKHSGNSVTVKIEASAKDKNPFEESPCNYTPNAIISPERIFASHISVFYDSDFGCEEIDMELCFFLDLLTKNAVLGMLDAEDELIRCDDKDEYETREVPYNRIRLKRDAPPDARKAFNEFAQEASKFFGITFES